MTRLALTFILYLLLPFQVMADLYIVGSATPYNWTRKSMDQTSTDVYRWEGYLTYGGELKFMTESSGWGIHWGPSVAYGSLPYGTSTISRHTSGDYKYRTDIEGYVVITVDVQARQITMTRQDGTLPLTRQYPSCLYPVGTSVGPGSDYLLHEVEYDSGTYSGRLALQQGTLAFHSQPYRTDRMARPITAKLSTQATATNKKLYLSLSTDKCSYSPGEAAQISASGTVPANCRIRIRHLADVVADTLFSASSKKWTWIVPSTDYRGYMAEVYTTDGVSDIIYGTIAIDVSSDWNRFPRYGFVATFGSEKSSTTIKKEMTWLNRCHINAVQFQDWHNAHDQPLAGTREKPLSSYKDIANRTILTTSIRNYIRYQHDFGMKSFFYNLCFGATDGYASRGVKEEWFAYLDKNHMRKDSHDLPSSWKSDIYLMNPANAEWQQYLADRNDDVYAVFDFDGYQIDQLGSRASLYDYDGNPINLTSGYASFIQAMKQRHPQKRLIMNAVSQYGASDIGTTGKVDCFYNEVWGCHEGDGLERGEGRFENLKQVLDANRSVNPALQTVFAAYMNYCCDNSNFNTPGVVMADAVMFALGGSHLELGDHMLCREYFPYTGQKWTAELEDWMTHYYDFLTAYENLLRGSWTDNSTIKVASSAVSINKWTPVAGQVTQLARNVEGRKVIHLLNFKSAEGSQEVDPNYLLCWHDRNGLRPWPREFTSLPLTITGLSGLGKVRRIWVSSPDYMGGAVQEITDYTLSSTTLRLTLPALQFWTMLVIEPESATTADNQFYGPEFSATSIDPTCPSLLQSVKSESQTYTFGWQGFFDTQVNLSAGTLTFSGTEVDAILPNAPWQTPVSVTYDLSGRPVSPAYRGFKITNGRVER